MITFDDDEPLEGTWTATSKKDPRWNGSGTATAIGNELPNEIDTWIEICRKNFGDPPKDLDKGFWPDVC